MKSTRGFTVIELVIVVAVLAASSILFFIQKSSVESSGRDSERKTAINAMYYSLEEVYYKENKSYPRTLTTETLPSVDPELFTDPSGNKLGEADSDYRYTAIDCKDDRCKGYKLTSQLDKEADYTKKNRN